jgi:hypothetical protein
MSTLSEVSQSGIGWVFPPQPQTEVVEVAEGIISGFTQLIEDQDYVDVVFSSDQPTSNWTSLGIVIVNTTDSTPINVWPGVISSKTASGFRLQLNGLPDSGNYYLRWSIRGVFGYTLDGPTSGNQGSASGAFTVQLVSGVEVDGTVVITPHASAGGTFTPITLSLTNDSPSATFTFTPAESGVYSIGATNNKGLIDSQSLSYVSYSDSYTLSGPSSGDVGVASTNFTVALPSGGVIPSSVIITPSDGGDGGTFTPTSVALTTASPSHTFTYTPATIGAKTISVTNSGGLTNPSPITYTSLFVGVLDHFTDTNGTQLPSHTMDYGPGWTRVEGTGSNQYTIQSNKLQSILDAVTAYNYLTESGISDFTMTVTVTFGVADANHVNQLLFRYSDSSNYFLVNIQGDGPVSIIKHQAASDTVLDSDTVSVTAGTPISVTIVVSGTSISATIGATNLSATSSFNQTATKVAIRCAQVSGAANTFEDFSVVP